jgi:hypothetical protein
MMKVRGRGRYNAVQRKLYTNQPRMDLFCTKSILLKNKTHFPYIYMEIQMGSGAKSYMKEKLNFPHIYGNSDGIGCKVIYEVMGTYLTEYEEAVSHI